MNLLNEYVFKKHKQKTPKTPVDKWGDGLDSQ